MVIVADQNMPHVSTLFNEFGNVTLVDGRNISDELLAKVEVLLIRSVTKITNDFIKKCPHLKFIGSATIGTDHIDLKALNKKDIKFANAPGCNATAVGEFVFLALLELALRYNSPLKDKTVGIIGAGNTGSALAKCLDAYGVHYLLCDPFLIGHDSRKYVSYAEILEQADVISLHVPLTTNEHPTYKMFDYSVLKNLRLNTWLVNCCRGDVIDNDALVQVKAMRSDLKLILDVWSNEPNPNPNLVSVVDIATPHIAGYSQEGKARGTYAVYSSFCDIMGVAKRKKLSSVLPLVKHLVTVSNKLDENKLLELLKNCYDLIKVDASFREEFKNNFDLLRKNHTYRYEFGTIIVNLQCNEMKWLFKLGLTEDIKRM